MNAILILLAIFSLTLLVSNLDFISRSKSFSFLSVPLLLGIAASPEYSLIPLLPSTRESLVWAIKVAIVWLGFLQGVEMAAQRLEKKKALQSLYYWSTFLVIAILFWVLFESVFIQKEFTTPVRVNWIIPVLFALLVFGSQISLFRTLLFLLITSYFITPTVIIPFYPIIYAVMIGVLLGFVSRMIIDPRQNLDASARLTLLGVGVLGAGWAIAMGLYEVVVGLALGWTLTFVHKYGICRDPSLRKTEQPLLFVISFFVGSYFEFDSWLFLLAGVSVLIRLLIKTLALKKEMPVLSIQEATVRALPVHPFAFVLVLSFQLWPKAGLQDSFLLSIFCVFFVINDLLSLVSEWFLQKEDKAWRLQ